MAYRVVLLGTLATVNVGGVDNNLISRASVYVCHAVVDLKWEALISVLKSTVTILSSPSEGDIWAGITPFPSWYADKNG